MSGLLSIHPVTGKPIIQNPDGTISTERTITIEADGTYYVIPTIVDGIDVGEDKAIELFYSGRNQPVGSFPTQSQADSYAQARSKKLGLPAPQERQKMDFAGLLSNPMFTAGMGILANAGGGVPPAQAIGRGLLGAQEMIQRQREQEMVNQYRQAQVKYQMGLLEQSKEESDLKKEKLDIERQKALLTTPEINNKWDAYKRLKELYLIELVRPLTQEESAEKAVLSAGVSSTTTYTNDMGYPVRETTGVPDFSGVGSAQPSTGGILSEAWMQPPTTTAPSAPAGPPLQQFVPPLAAGEQDMSSVYEATGMAAGPIASARRGLASVFGILPGRQAPSTTAATQEVKNFNNTFRGKLRAHAGKYLKFDVESVTSLLPNVEGWLVDRENEMGKVISLRDELLRRISSLENTIDRGGIPKATLHEKLEEIALYREGLDLIGPLPPTVKSPADLDSMGVAPGDPFFTPEGTLMRRKK